MEKIINELLLEESKRYWENNGVLHKRKDTSILTKDSIPQLLNEMNSRKITKLKSYDSLWELDVHGNYKNSSSDEKRSGNINNLKKLGNLFRRQNRNLNPFYQANSSDDGFDRGLMLTQVRRLRKRVSDLDIEIKQLEDLLS
jgi:hypothetical protein